MGAVRAAARGDSSAAADVGRWPLIGREHELSRLIRAVGTSSVLVTGPAGVGKTRLLDELHGRVAGSERRAWRLTATHTSSAIPFGTVAPLLLDGHRGIRQTLAGARDVAARLASDVVMIDDAHLLDQASATLVHHLVQLDTTVVAAVRSDAPTVPDAVLATARDGLATRLDLAGLDSGSVRDLLRAVLEADVDDATLRRLQEISGGNLLYLQELVTGALDAGALIRERDVWRLTAPAEVSPGLAQLVEIRLAGVEQQQRDLLELIAVAEPMSLADAEQLLGEEGLTGLEAMGLARLDRSGRRHEVRLAQPVYGEVLRAGMSSLRRVALHRLAAEQLERHPLRRKDDAVRAAIHRLEGGGQLASSTVIAAARHAIAGGDAMLGARLAKVAVVAGDDATGGLLLSEALTILGEHGEAGAALDAAWSAAVTDEHLALLAMRRALLSFWVDGDTTEAFARLDDGASRITDPQYLDELDAQRATFMLLRGDFASAIRRAEPLLEPAHGRPAIVAAIAAAPALAVTGRGEEALRVATAAHEAVLHVGSELVMSAPAIHVVGRVLALQEMGRIDQARVEARVGYDAVVEVGDVEGQAWLALMLGRTELLAGHLGTAGRWFDEGASVFAHIGFSAQERWCRAGRVLVDAWRRDTNVAVSAQRMVECDAGCTAMMEADVLRASAWAAAVTDDLATATTMLEAAARLAREQGAATLESTCLHDLVRLDATTPVERLFELAAGIDGDIAALRARHAHAAASGDAGALMSVAEEFEELGAHLPGAEAAAQSGAILLAEGQRNRARQVWHRAARLATATEGAQTPLLDLCGRGAELTPRERAVARMAAAGATSSSIAGRLDISRRTVENHLQRTYEKLGVHNRDQLASVVLAD